MNYLIPANTKRGKLILGFFKPHDLFILAGGILVTLLLMATSEMSSPIITILVLSPAIICGFLVLPVPYYHNVLNIIIAVKDYTAEQKMMQEHARNFLKKEMNVCQMIMTI